MDVTEILRAALSASLSLWESLPVLFRVLLVLAPVAAAAAAVLGRLAARKAKVHPAAAVDGEKRRKGKAARPKAGPQEPVAVGTIGSGDAAREVSWDGSCYHVAGVAAGISPAVLGQSMLRSGGRLLAGGLPDRPGVLGSLPPGMEQLPGPCPHDGTPMVLIESPDGPGTWQAHCGQDRSHDRCLTEAEAALLARVTGLSLLAGRVETPDGGRDLLWDGQAYRVPGVRGTLARNGLPGLAARPQVCLYEPHAGMATQQDGPVV